MLVARVPPLAVEGGPGIRAGATVRIGSTSFVVERVTSDAEPRDLTRETILAATDLAKRAGIGDAQKVDDALTLVDRLGTIIAGQDQRTDFTAEAKVDERPYRISCATNVACAASTSALDRRSRARSSRPRRITRGSSRRGPSAGRRRRSRIRSRSRPRRRKRASG